MRVWLVAVVLMCGRVGWGQLTPEQAAFVDASVRVEMEETKVPAVSVAMVVDGRVAYVKAYGEAELGVHARPAGVETRFAIGSVSKQFTAAAVLLLVGEGKLGLDDVVGKWLPELTRAGEVTVRELLGHTAGYQDYFTEEDIPAEKQRGTTVEAILGNWGRRPLEFDPGTRWGYSGTNYVIAARIVEKVSGEPLFEFLKRHVLVPVGITDAVLADEPGNGRDAVGYYRFGAGPARVAPKTGRNWLFGMAELSMTAEDLAKWDVSVMKQTLLRGSAYDAMRDEVMLKDGKGTGYGLGVMLREVTDRQGARFVVMEHPGEISGFRSGNYIVPEAGAALVILTNAEYSDGVQDLAKRLQGPLGFGGEIGRGVESKEEMRARGVLEGLARGELDRTEMTAEGAGVFTEQVLGDLRASILPLGRLVGVKVVQREERGGAVHLAIRANYEFGGLEVSEYVEAGGRIGQFFVDVAHR